MNSEIKIGGRDRRDFFKIFVDIFLNSYHLSPIRHYKNGFAQNIFSEIKK